MWSGKANGVCGDRYVAATTAAPMAPITIISATTVPSANWRSRASGRTVGSRSANRTMKTPAIGGNTITSWIHNEMLEMITMDTYANSVGGRVTATARRSALLRP